jgi:hypothetical protein
VEVSDQREPSNSLTDKSLGSAQFGEWRNYEKLLAPSRMALIGFHFGENALEP